MPQYKQFSSYYFIIFVAIAAIGLIWYFSNTNSSSVSNANENINENINTGSQAETKANININYNSNSNINLNANENINIAIGGNEETGLADDLGIAVSGYEITKTSSGDVVNLALGGENNISVMPTSYEGIVKNSISIQTQEEVIVSGINGIKYTGGSAKDGSAVSFVLIENNGKLYYFKGTDNFLSNLNNIIKFN